MVGEGHKDAPGPHPHHPGCAARQQQSQDLETNPQSKAAPTPFALTFPLSVAHSK